MSLICSKFLSSSMSKFSHLWAVIMPLSRADDHQCVTCTVPQDPTLILPVFVVTNHYELGVSQFWKQVQNQVVDGCTSSKGYKGETFLAFPASGGSTHFLAYDCMTPIFTSVLWLTPLWASLLRTLVFGFRAQGDNLEWSHLKIFCYICKDPFSK